MMKKKKGHISSIFRCFKFNKIIHIDCYNQDTALNKVVKISLFVVNDSTLLEEIIQEIKEKSSGPICNMFKALFKKKILAEFGMLNNFLACFFAIKRISEISIYDASNLGVNVFSCRKTLCFLCMIIQIK